MDITQALSLARRIAEAIAEGRVEAAKVATMTDEELATYDTAAYQALLDAQAANEKLVGNG
jgi:hypothetical protein